MRSLQLVLIITLYICKAQYDYNVVAAMSDEIKEDIPIFLKICLYYSDNFKRNAS